MFVWPRAVTETDKMTTTTSPIKTPSTEYIGVTETAKLIRAALKKAFPGVGFSIKSNRCSMGTSITVRFSGDTSTRDVEKITDAYNRTGFDGMIDGSYARYAWLAPDGTASRAYSQGRVGNDGKAIPEFGEPHAPNCRYVRFGADFVMVQKDFN